MTTHRYTAQEMLQRADIEARLFRDAVRATTGVHAELPEDDDGPVAEILRQAAADLQARPTREELGDLVTLTLNLDWKRGIERGTESLEWLKKNAKPSFDTGLRVADALIASGKVQVRSE